MAFKLVVFCWLLAFAWGSVVPVSSDDYDVYPQYRFGYDVADSLTGDYKTQQEQRDGDQVQGQYSLVDPDGTRRIVDYAADPINGFIAVVRKEPLVAVAPAVVAARYRTAAAYTPTRYAAARVVERYAATPLAAAPAPVFARYSVAPAAARYAAASVVDARYASPFASAPVAAYSASLAGYTSYAEPAPVATYVAPARYAAAGYRYRYP